MISAYQLKSLNVDEPSLQKIRDDISILKLHLKECIKNRNYQEAELTDKTIIKLQGTEKKRLLEELKNNQRIQKERYEEQIELQREKLIQEKAEIEHQFQRKINRMIEDFQEFQQNDRNNYHLSFEKVYSKKSRIDKNEMNKVQAEIQKCVKAKDYKRAEMLNNKILTWKEDLEDADNIQRQTEIENAMNHIKQLQKEEADRYWNNIEKQKEEFYIKHNIKYNKLQTCLDEKLQRLQFNHQIEAKNFLNVIKEEKSGIILSPQMNDIVSEHFKKNSSKKTSSKTKIINNSQWQL